MKNYKSCNKKKSKQYGVLYVRKPKANYIQKKDSLLMNFRAMISKMSQSAQGDIEKGQHVRQQLVRLFFLLMERNRDETSEISFWVIFNLLKIYIQTLWENFLESRIRTQKVVELANQLPQVIISTIELKKGQL